jgi:hypothetical protein
MSTLDRSPETTFVTPTQDVDPSPAFANRPQEQPLRNGSEWGRRALDHIRRMHQDEEYRQEVARRVRGE